jgi:hypothetical protein
VNKKHNVNIDSADTIGRHVKLKHFPRPPVEAAPSILRVTPLSLNMSEEAVMTNKNEIATKMQNRKFSKNVYLEKIRSLVQ